MFYVLIIFLIPFCSTLTSHLPPSRLLSLVLVLYNLFFFFLCLKIPKNFFTPLHPTFFLLYSPYFVFCFFCLLGTPVFPLFTLWHHPVPPTASLCYSSGAGCLGYSLSGPETARDNLNFKLHFLKGVKVPISGFCYHSNSASLMANLGPYWLKSASHPLPNAALRGL